MALECAGTYSITSTCGDTVAEQTIKEYRDEEKQMTKNIIEKETRNKSGTSVKLIGSTFTFTEGYPPFLFDAVLLTLNEKKTTLFNAFLCSVTSRGHMDIFNEAVEKSLDGVAFSSFRDDESTPDFIKKAFPEFMRRCGFTAQKEGEHIDFLEKLKEAAAGAYEKVMSAPPSPCPVDELRSFMTDELSQNEHMLFAKLGLSVPTKCQKAMFTLMAEETDVKEVSSCGTLDLE